MEANFLEKNPSLTKYKANLNQAALGWFFIEVGMNILEIRGMGLISTPTIDVLLNGERPKSLSELIRHQQIKKEAEEAAKRVSLEILEKMKRTNKATF